MKTEEMIDRSIAIITRYYENDLEPFFESIADDVLWVGPAHGQWLRGKKALIEAWTTEQHELTFTMGDIKAQCLSPHTRVKEVLLTYDIYTHYPSGNTDMHEQRLHFTWQERRQTKGDEKEWVAEILLIDISNLWHYDRRDTIYPVHLESTYAPIRLSLNPKRFVNVKATDHSIYRVLVDHVLYFETIKHSSRLNMHTEKGTITINGTLPELERAYPDMFLRIHACYMINPDAVQEIYRFGVKLTNGDELPIPEKKYTAIKRQLLAVKEERGGVER